MTNWSSEEYAAIEMEQTAERLEEEARSYHKHAKRIRDAAKAAGRVFNTEADIAKSPAQIVEEAGFEIEGATATFTGMNGWPIEDIAHAILQSAASARNATLDEAAAMLQSSYPDNANTNAFCAAIRSLKSNGTHTPDHTGAE